jgi:anti-sigma regulatory factor (Ser/Thr protein kinase)
MPNSVEVVELDLPLSTRHASTARVVAASLAADAGFTVDEIDDLRLGLNEAVSVVADAADVEAVNGDGGASRLLLRFEVDGKRITIHASQGGTGAVTSTDGPDELAQRILGAVVDSFAYDGGRFVITKSSLGTSAFEADSEAGSR